jgi:predicted negative regulator of RcsB-dependent stress response
MDVYSSEEEQIQKIRDWWKKYGSSVLVGIIVFLLATFGGKYWHRHKAQQTNQASLIYQQLIGAQQHNKLTEFALFVQHLKKDYSGTPYASLAALLSAQNYVAKNDMQSAQKDLRWVLKNSSVAGVTQIARIRLARILAAEKQAPEALQLLQKIDDKTFMPMIYETRGDILLRMQKSKKALTAYRKAESLSQSKIATRLLKMKINKLCSQ